MRLYHRSSKKYDHYKDREYWWYGLSNGAKKYSEDDIILFEMKDFKQNCSAYIKISFAGKWKKRILNASRQPNNNIQMKIWRYKNGEEVKLYFGKVCDGVYNIEDQLFVDN